VVIGLGQGHTLTSLSISILNNNAGNNKKDNLVQYSISMYVMSVIFAAVAHKTFITRQHCMQSAVLNFTRDDFEHQPYQYVKFCCVSSRYTKRFIMSRRWKVVYVDRNCRFRRLYVVVLVVSAFNFCKS